MFHTGEQGRDSGATKTFPGINERTADGFPLTGMVAYSKAEGML